MKPNCSRHKREIAGISDMKQLAEMVGDLHYESLAEFLYCLSDKFFKDGKKDEEGKRVKLAKNLFKAQKTTHRSYQHIDQAWKVSEPYMK